jgi:hypothetical protein
MLDTKGYKNTLITCNTHYFSTRNNGCANLPLYWDIVYFLFRLMLTVIYELYRYGYVRTETYHWFFWLLIDIFSDFLSRRVKSLNENINLSCFVISPLYLCYILYYQFIFLCGCLLWRFYQESPAAKLSVWLKTKFTTYCSGVHALSLVLLGIILCTRRTTSFITFLSVYVLMIFGESNKK